MKHDDLRAAIQREPFKPFDIHTQAARSYPVVHPENIAFSPRVDVVLVKYGDGHTAMIELAAITEVSYPAARPKKA